jgi:hypothetical protein
MPGAYVCLDDDQARTSRLLLLDETAVRAGGTTRRSPLPWTTRSSTAATRTRLPPGRSEAWKAIAAARLLLSTDAGARVSADRAPADAWSSSEAGVSGDCERRLLCIRYEERY